jgi:hypothetical protein
VPPLLSSLRANNCLLVLMRRADINGGAKAASRGYYAFCLDAVKWRSYLMVYGGSCLFTSGVFGNMPEIRHITHFALTFIFSMFRLPHTCVQVCICGHPLHFVLTITATPVVVLFICMYASFCPYGVVSWYAYGGASLCYLCTHAYVCGCRFLTHRLYDLLVLLGELLHEVVLSKGGRRPEFWFLG